MRRKKWRYFRPRFRFMGRASSKYQPAASDDFGDVYEAVEARIKRKTRGRFKKKYRQVGLDAEIEDLRRKVDNMTHEEPSRFERAAAWLEFLAFQSPRAAQAQQQMDSQKSSYKNKQDRLMELIDFNDAFVGTVLAMSHSERKQFNLKAKNLINKICKKAGVRCFSDTQFNAIAHGLSREVAVFLGVQNEGFTAKMTSRSEDALGVDMVITDPETGRFINADIKTVSAFRFRVRTLLQEGRISEAEANMALIRGFIKAYSGHHENRVLVTIWRIDHEMLGDIDGYTFLDSRPLGNMLRLIIDDKE